MAPAVTSSDSPVIEATIGSDAPSPRTAIARATSRLPCGIRRNRISTRLETARDPIARTVSACAASGRTPSASRALSSWRSSSGLPEVVRKQAATNASSAPSSPVRTTSAVPEGLSGAGVTETASGARVSSWSSSSSTYCSPVRQVATTSTGRSSSRRAR